MRLPTAAIKDLDETPGAVLEHDAKQADKPASEKKPNDAHVIHHEKHSLRGKHGKTHAVC